MPETDVRENDQVYEIIVFDDGNNKFEKYPNEWYIVGKSLGKCYIVNAHYSSININSISEWKLLPINTDDDII